MDHKGEQEWDPGQGRGAVNVGEKTVVAGSGGEAVEMKGHVWYLKVGWTEGWAGWREQSVKDSS